VLRGRYRNNRKKATAANHPRPKVNIMPSTTIADYQVLKDAQFTLEEQDAYTMKFQVPSDFAVESGARQPILAFKLLPLQDNTAFKVYVNDRQVITQANISQSHTRGWWESFSARTAFPHNAPFPTDNTVEIRVTNGKAQFSDVVIWYQIRREG